LGFTTAAVTGLVGVAPGLGAVGGLKGAGPVLSAGFLWVFMLSETFLRPGFLCVFISSVTFFSPLVISDPLLRAANSAEASGAGADLVDDVDTGGGGGIFPGGGGGGTPAGAAGAAGAADLSDFASPPLGFHTKPVR